MDEIKLNWFDYDKKKEYKKHQMYEAIVTRNQFYSWLQNVFDTHSYHEDRNNCDVIRIRSSRFFEKLPRNVLFLGTKITQDLHDNFYYSTHSNNSTEYHQK